MGPHEAALNVLGMADNHCVSYDLLHSMGYVPMPGLGRGVSAQQAKSKAVSVLAKYLESITDRLRNLEARPYHHRPGEEP